MIVCVCVIENEIVRLSYHERVGVCVIETRRDSLLDSWMERRREYMCF